MGGQLVSRRQVAKGLAWTAPAVMVAASVPAAALSGGPPTFSFVRACKSPGNSCSVFPKGYEFRFTVCNDTGQTVYIYSVAYTTVGTNLTLTHATPSLPFAIAPTGCRDVVFRADSSNSANQVFDGTMTLGWGHTPTQGADPHPHPPIVVGFSVTGTTPDCPCSATPNP